MTAFVLLSLTAPRPTPTLPTPHYPLPCTIFLPYERSVGFASVQSLWAFNFGHPCPSLVKGRWIDGKAQTVALLLSACDMPTLFILQTFLLSRRRDCTPSAPSMRFSALSHSLFVLQSSVCLYGFAFALSHSLFILQSSVCLYGFAFALSHSLFVGERACPSRNITAIIKNKLIEL